MSSFAPQSVSRPLSVQEVMDRAEDLDFHASTRLRLWIRAASSLLQEARIYESEGDDQQAFFLYYRHAFLVLNYLPTHPEANVPEYRAIVRALERNVEDPLSRCEYLKPRVARRYDLYQRAIQDRDTRRREALAERSRTSIGELGLGEGSPRHSLDTTREGVRAITAGENRKLAVELAQKEQRRRRRIRGPSLQDEFSKLSVQGGYQSRDDEEVMRRMEATRQQMDKKYQIDDREARNIDGVSSPRANESTQYRYPAVPRKSQRQSYYEESYERTPDVTEPLHPAPEVPRKINRYDSSITNYWNKPFQQYSNDQPPPKPLYIRQEDASAFPPRPEKEPLSSDTISRSSTSSPPTGPESSAFTFKPAAYLENGTPLRTIFLPPSLRTTFLSYALGNTRANLETCGILCGTLISNALFISKLVIPEQTATSDTCETTNDGALFDYCDKEDLMVLGWIHTHPSQTCFMSSLDLHTHAGYQVMMPESIAIVCAPSKDPSWGVFRLTDPPGMKSVLNCKQTGLFHPHADDNVYTDALRPGHVFEADGLNFGVVDLRLPPR